MSRERSLKFPNFRDAPFSSVLALAILAFVVSLLAAFALFEGPKYSLFRVLYIAVASIPGLALSGLWVSAVNARVRESPLHMIDLVGAPLALAWPLALLKLIFLQLNWI
jgi:hypothetical protein